MIDGERLPLRFGDAGVMWVTFDDGLDTTALADAAAASGIEFNPGAGWSADPDDGRNRLRLCFGHLDMATIEAGVAELAAVVRTARSDTKGAES